MRLQVRHRSPAGPGDAVEGGELVQDVVGELGRRDVDEPAAEPGEVAVGDLGADGDPGLDGAGTDPTHDRRVAGVEAAGDVRAGHDAEQGLVVPQPPDSEPLTQVGIEIDPALGHRRSLASGT